MRKDNTAVNKSPSEIPITEWQFELAPIRQHLFLVAFTMR
jgi:hypothetical protein